MSDRHPWNDEFVGYLHRYVVGLAAEACREQELPSVGAVAVLPTWTWGVARIEVGAKDRGRDGQRLQLPVPVAWQPSPVVVLPEGQEASVAASVVGMGYSTRGRVDIVCRPGMLEPETTSTEEGLPLPTSMAVPSVTRRRLASQLDALVADGRHAYWQALQMLEPTLNSALSTAVKHVSAEAYEGGGPLAGQALDESDVEAIRTAMMLGEDDKGPGAIHRLIEKAATPAGRFAGVDPQRYVVTAIRRDAKAAVRKAVGDPHIGPKVRAVARELGTEDLEVLLPVYRKRYPADNLSVDRATSALELRRRPSASHFSIQETDVPQQSFEDDVAERVDRSRQFAARSARRRLVVHNGARSAESEEQRAPGPRSGQGENVIELTSSPTRRRRAS